MGRNGAGKSTLLKVAAGLLAPTRGKLRGGRVALLLQNPGDYALHDRVGDELPADALAAAGLAQLADRHPRDLSGGERQRLALAIVLHGERPAVVCLDEPTRGMDRAPQGRARRRCSPGSRRRAARWSSPRTTPSSPPRSPTRTVLLGDGRPVADAPTAEVLAGGWYFATQTARILGGAALLPEDGRRAVLRREVVVGDELGRSPRSCCSASRSTVGFALVRAQPPERARARAGGDAGGAGRARADRVRAAAERQADDRHRPAHRLRARRRARASRSARSPRSPPTCSSARARGRRGRWSAGAVAGLLGAGLARVVRAGAGPRRAGRRVRASPALVYGAIQNVSLWVMYSGDHTLGQAGAYFATSFAVRRRARGSAAPRSASRSGRRSCARCGATGRASR